MINFAMLRYEEDTMRRLSVEMIQNNTVSLPKTTTKETTKGVSSPIYGGVEDTVERTVSRSAADNTIS